MAIQAPGVPQYLGPRMNALPRVNAGPTTTAEMFGAAGARELMRVADAGQKLGLSMLVRAQEEQKRLDQACVRDGMNQLRTRTMEGEAEIFATRGIDAADAPERMQKLLDGLGRSCSTTACSPSFGGGSGNVERQRMWQDASSRFYQGKMAAARRHQLAQGRAYQKQSILDQMEIGSREAFNIGAGLDGSTVTAQQIEEERGAPLVGDLPFADEEGGAERVSGDGMGGGGRQPLNTGPEEAQRVETEFEPAPMPRDAIAMQVERVRAAAAMLNSGSTPHHIKSEQDKAESRIHLAVIDGMASAGRHEQALEYINQEEVRAVMPSAEWTKRRNAMGKIVVAEAKKRSESDARRLGIELGDTYDNEYEILKALDGQDGDVAAIAHREAEVRRKARLAMGKGAGGTPEDKARENRLAREQAKAIVMGEDPDDPADDIEDEDDLDFALDERGDLTEYMREKVRKYGVAEMKARKKRQAAERKTLDEEAVKVMAAAKWDVSAIDPSWPDDLQDKMLDRAIKREEATDRRETRQAASARKAKALEYLEMPLDRLNEKVLAGGYLDMIEEIGPGTPEAGKLNRRLSGQDAGGPTMLQLAKNEFTRIVGDPAKKKKDYAAFIAKVGEARTSRTRELGLDNPGLLPDSEQKKIIGDMLAKGDYRWFEWSGFMSPNKYRYQVADEDLDGWKPFDAPAPEPAPIRPAAASSLVGAADLPDFARPYVGARDRRRVVLADGRVLIESAAGKVSIINQDGSFVDSLAVAGKGTE